MIRLLVLPLVWLAANAQASQELANSAGCNMCHAPAQQLLGPSYQAIAGKYAGDSEAIELLLERTRAGSQGVWGPAAMPPTSSEKVPDAELRQIVEWVLSSAP